ncbi:hypothetical protein C8J55DRAFT_556508 [Lentinula edodes]|uniref:Uncharacterized protein n=1 Tax=Lentinula lateritia TaxID=40482 RepID=A0A9W9DYG6_9AGAR|nr:hypothetical protein C8J55DRAFT_556508 [Lentinula edodes]
MLFLPLSLLRSLCVLVLIPSAILGVWAMPLAPRDALSTIPQLESRAPGSNRNLKLPLVLLRYDKGGLSSAASTVRDLRNTDRDGPRITLLEDGEYWVLRLGSTRRVPKFFEATEVQTSGRSAFKIQSREPTNRPQLGVTLGNVLIKAKDEEALFNAIQSLPGHSDKYSALQGVMKYLLGEIPEHPLLEGVVYNGRTDMDQLLIFSAMADPSLEHQYPKSWYLKLKPGVTKQDWYNFNHLQNDVMTATWPFRGTVMQGSTLFSHNQA